MTEKSYGGNNGVREHLGKIIKNKRESSGEQLIRKTKKTLIETNNISSGLSYYIKAGEIAKEVVLFAKSIITPGIPLLEIAKKIEKKIYELKAEPAFPVNLSINDIAAHYHPTLEDKTIASGLLKVDIGVHINGFIADTAFSLDLTPDKKYIDLIKASEEALEAALKILDKNPTFNDIGSVIQKTIEKKGFSTIVNLSGHSLSHYNLHAGITIPNYANNNLNKITDGAYALEPFATSGEGKVYEGVESNIYKIINLKNPRGETARKILKYINEKYKTLPFSLREIQEIFGNSSRIAVKELEQLKIIYNFPQLIEVSHKPVSQAEHTFVKTPEGKIIITTK